MGKMPGQKKEQPKCTVCGQVYKCYQIYPKKRMIKHICKCNENILNEIAEELKKRQKEKIDNNPNYKGVRVIEFKM